MIHHLRTMNWKLAGKEFGAVLIILGVAWAGLLVAWAATLPEMPQ